MDWKRAIGTGLVLTGAALGAAVIGMATNALVGLATGALVLILIGFSLLGSKS